MPRRCRLCFSRFRGHGNGFVKHPTVHRYSTHPRASASASAPRTRRASVSELQRHGATANIDFFDESPDDPAVQVMIAALIDETSHTATGQENYVANDTSP